MTLPSKSGASLSTTSAPDAHGAPVAARLTDDASQAVFRGLLEALARPGRVTRLPVDAAVEVPPALLPPLALADVDLTVAVLTGDPAGHGQDEAAYWSDVLRTATGARPAGVETADMVVALRAPLPGEIAVMRRGDALHPEQGARLVVACRALTSVLARSDPIVEGTADITETAAGRAPEVVEVTVTGPGVREAKGVRLRVDGIAAEVVEALTATNRHFPSGIDTWLVAADRTVVGLPRSSCLWLDMAGQSPRLDAEDEGDS